MCAPYLSLSGQSVDDLLVAALALSRSFNRPLFCRPPDPRWQRPIFFCLRSLQPISSSGADDSVFHLNQRSANDEAAMASKDRLYGFARPHMYKDVLHGTVLPYQKHVFLCFREPSDWPPQIETSSSPAYELPHSLAASLKAHEDQLPKKTRFTLCRGSDVTAASRGDILVFPDMIKYKDFVSPDIEGFVKDFLIHEGEWSPERAEKLDGFHIFVCAHASRDMQCGVCGPALLERFEREISSQGLGSFVFVRPCSHVGGHKYAGNVIIYGKDSNGNVTGHWYGYVTPSDVVILLDQHIGKGQIIHRLWRGGMGMAEEQ